LAGSAAACKAGKVAMKHKFSMIGAVVLIFGGATGVSALAESGPSDAEIAHIAYTAGQIDIAAARQALAKSNSAEVRGFAEVMLRDHQAVEAKALALVKKLGVTPADNATSQALAKQAAETRDRLASLNGAAFDSAYIHNEAAYHGTVNAALKSSLIPAADNPELRSLLETGLQLFGEHQGHAEMLAKKI
jgi:putative membrane protein